MIVETCVSLARFIAVVYCSGGRGEFRHVELVVHPNLMQCVAVMLVKRTITREHVGAREDALEAALALFLHP